MSYNAPRTLRCLCFRTTRSPYPSTRLNPRAFYCPSLLSFLFLLFFLPFAYSFPSLVYIIIFSAWALFRAALVRMSFLSSRRVTHRPNQAAISMNMKAKKTLFFRPSPPQPEGT